MVKINCCMKCFFLLISLVGIFGSVMIFGLKAQALVPQFAVPMVAVMIIFMIFGIVVDCYRNQENVHFENISPDIVGEMMAENNIREILNNAQGPENVYFENISPDIVGEMMAENNIREILNNAQGPENVYFENIAPDIVGGMMAEKNIYEKSSTTPKGR